MSYSEWMRRHRRLVGIPFVIAALYFAHIARRQMQPGLLIIAAGILLRIWASGHLKKEQILTTGGPYRVIRNPLYFGSLLVALGFFFITHSYWILLLTAVYFAISYVPVIRYEEKVLSEKFPGLYSEYSQKVPAFFPTFKPWKYPNTHFSWEQVWKNKEYGAVIGVALVIVLLAVLKDRL